MVGNIIPFASGPELFPFPQHQSLSVLSHLNNYFAAQHATTAATAAAAAATANIPSELIGALFNRMSTTAYPYSGQIDPSFFSQPNFMSGNTKNASFASPERNNQMQESIGDCEEANEIQSALLEDLPPVARDDEVSDFILSSLAISGRTGFTEQELANEQAGLTDEERSAALSDIFGKLCNLNDHHKGKKARRDLCGDSISFLVKQMRIELERVPERQKMALMEARKKCRNDDEFSDARCEQFCRCEGMNPKVSEQRSISMLAFTRLDSPPCL